MIICQHIQRTLLLTMLLVLSAGVLGNNGQPLVSISIEHPSEVLQNEDFLVSYSVIINDYTDEPSMPEIDKFNDFKVVSGPQNQASILRNFFGEPQAISIVVTYRLSPTKSGVCSLPQAKYKMHGKTYKSEKAKINIIENRSNEKNIKELKDGEAFIRPIMSRKTMSPTDTMRITYRLYSKVPIYSLESAYTFPFPRRDFYFNDITNNRQPEHKEVYEGTEYFVRDIRTLIVQPKGEGRKTIQGGSIELIYTNKTGFKIRNRYGKIVDEVVYLKKELKIEDINISVTKLIII